MAAGHALRLGRGRGAGGRDLLEIVSDGGRPRWLIGATRGKGLPAARLASVALTSFRDACAQTGLSLPEIARVVDRSVARPCSCQTYLIPTTSLLKFSLA